MNKKFFFVIGILNVNLAFAAGFHNQMQTASLLGNAYSGTGAIAEDASVSLYNPGGMVALKSDKSFSIGGNLNYGRFTMYSGSAKKSIGNTFISQSSSENIDSNYAMPNGHYAHKISENAWFGMNVFSPYNWKLNYKEDSVARYSATTSQLKSVNISPSLAYKINNSFALGIGLDFLYFDAKLASLIGSNAIEGYQNNDGNAWSEGFNIGALYSISTGLRIGVSYRSAHYLDITGDSHQKNPNNGNIKFLKFRTEIDLPEQITLSYYQEVNDEWDATIDLAWSRWSRFKRLFFRFSDSGYHVTRYKYKNALRFAVGGAYKWSDTWKIKFGLSLDESPVRQQYQTARFPDANRFWFSTGVGYNYSNRLRFDLGYSFIKFHSIAVNEQSPASSLTLSNTFSAKFKSWINVLGMQVTYSLC